MLGRLRFESRGTDNKLHKRCDAGYIVKILSSQPTPTKKKANVCVIVSSYRTCERNLPPHPIFQIFCFAHIKPSPSPPMTGDETPGVVTRPRPYAGKIQRENALLTGSAGPILRAG